MYSNYVVYFEDNKATKVVKLKRGEFAETSIDKIAVRCESFGEAVSIAESRRKVTLAIKNANDPLYLFNFDNGEKWREDRSHFVVVATTLDQALDKLENYGFTTQLLNFVDKVPFDEVLEV
jgi:hypothetical protein